MLKVSKDLNQYDITLYERYSFCNRRVSQPWRF